MKLLLDISIWAVPICWYVFIKIRYSKDLISENSFRSKYYSSFEFFHVFGAFS